MKAVVMAGGKGTRLRPLTCDRPKPMVPVANRPMLEHVIRLLRLHGFAEIYATLHYMPEAIETYFGTGEALGVRMRYAIEDTPLGTAGSVKACERHLDSTFLVISGDALTDIDLACAVEFHRAKGAIATIVLTRVPNPLEYGVVITDDDGRIARFLEKPSWSEVFSDTVNTGIYVLEPDALDYFEPGQQFDFSKNLFPLILKKGLPLFGFIAKGYWSDVGTIDQYRQTQYDILEGRARVDIPGDQVEKGIYIGTGIDIHPNARLSPPVVIGDDCRIRRNVEIGRGTIVGCQNILNEGASAKRSIIWNGSYIGKDVELRGAIICSRTSIKAKSAVFEGSVVASGCSVGERSTIKPGVKIWPDKAVDAGTTLTTSLVWGAKWSRRLFGSYGVSGLANVDITPEFVSKLGAAYATCFGERPSIVVSSDAYRPSRMLKRALAAGLLSGGANVYDLGRMTTPVTRYAVAALDVSGGLHIRLSPYDPNIVLIEFLDEMGISVDKAMERKIENTFFSEDFRRAGAEGIGEVAFLTRVVEQYLEGLLKTVCVESVRARRFTVVVGYDPGNLSLLLPSLLDALGLNVALLESDNAEDLRPKHFLDMFDSLHLLSGAVISRKADLGIIVDSNAERLLLVDEQGESVSEEMFMALMSLLILKSREGATVAVPVTAPRIIEEMARNYRGRVVRTRANPRSVMEKVIEEKILIGGKDLPAFQPSFDALMSLAKILEVMARENVRLSQLVSMVPQFYMSKRTVECPWEAKGKVMRTLIEETRTERVELIDGIKVYHDTGWALILPDSEEPLFHVYSEARTPAEAEALREAYMVRISDIQLT